MANPKKDYDKALTRMTYILRRLNEGETLSVKELADEFGVSTRTIQRDINERLHSYPIEKIGKKFRFEEGYSIAKSHSLEDILVLDILERVSESVGPLFSTKAKTLLKKMKNKSSANPIFTKLFLEDISDKLDEISAIESAIEAKIAISCKYEFDEYSKNIDLEPLKIISFEGFWYLLARDSRNKIVKKYYLKNISDVKAKSEKFLISSELKERLDSAINVWFEPKNEPYRVTLFIDGEIVKYFKRKPISKNQVVSSLYDDGSMEITFKITHNNEVSREILKWIPHIKVLEPESLKAEIESSVKEWMERNLEQNAH
ncbi:MAG: helix-turn-helix transcriptional regulator [Campylobacterales bacterium]